MHSASVASRASFTWRILGIPGTQHVSHRRAWHSSPPASSVRVNCACIFILSWNTDRREITRRLTKTLLSAVLCNARVCQPLEKRGLFAVVDGAKFLAGEQFFFFFFFFCGNEFTERHRVLSTDGIVSNFNGERASRGNILAIVGDQSKGSSIPWTIRIGRWDWLFRVKVSGSGGCYIIDTLSWFVIFQRSKYRHKSRYSWVPRYRIHA